MQDEFLFELNGLIKSEFVNIQTDSKKVLLSIIELMDSSETNMGLKVQKK